MTLRSSVFESELSTSSNTPAGQICDVCHTSAVPLQREWFSIYKYTIINSTSSSMDKNLQSQARKEILGERSRVPSVGGKSKKKPDDSGITGLSLIHIVSRRGQLTIT